MKAAGNMTCVRDAETQWPKVLETRGSWEPLVRALRVCTLCRLKTPHGLRRQTLGLGAGGKQDSRDGGHGATEATAEVDAVAPACGSAPGPRSHRSSGLLEEHGHTEMGQGRVVAPAVRWGCR